MKTTLAQFASVEAAPEDAEMWPVHPAAWLQPELMPALPASSGLRVERRYAAPTPDWLRPDPPQPGQSPAPATLPDWALPNLRLELPASDLAPLGWDPRAACRKGER